MKIRIAALAMLALMVLGGVAFVPAQVEAAPIKGTDTAYSGFREVKFTFYADQNGNHWKDASESVSSNRIRVSHYYKYPNSNPTGMGFKVELRNVHTGNISYIELHLPYNTTSYSIQLSNDLTVDNVFVGASQVRWCGSSNMWRVEMSPQPANYGRGSGPHGYAFVNYGLNTDRVDVLVHCDGTPPVSGE